MAEEQAESYQTNVDQQGQEAAGEEAPAEAEDWGAYVGDESDEPSFEAQQDDSAGEEEAPATTDGEEKTPAEKEEEQRSEEQADEEEQPQEEEKSEEERREEQRNVWENYEKAKQEARQKLEEQYALSDEQADQLLENPQAELPKILAQMYTDVFEDVMEAVQVNFPSLQQQYEQQAKQQQRSEEEFYSQWPNLKEHRDTVDRVAQVYRAQNPNVSREQFIREVGAQASWAVGTPPAEDSDQEERTTPHQPAAPASRGAAPGPTSEPDLGFEEQEDLE